MKNKKIMFGKNCIRNTRIPYSVIDSLIQEHYPSLTLNSIIESIREDNFDAKYNGIYFSSTSILSNSLMFDYYNDVIWDSML